ncbi:MAG TPA: ATP-binding protein, partial [Candidatus Eisenbacteria bacterium]|nr:ATP-binding protein [Candidatus Eisenbacteria bacterium]
DELRRPLEVSADQRYLCIRATDDGIGMDEATRSRIFEPFFTTKPQGEGTGLGLSVLYGIVASHSGFIDVESSPNEGTTFRIYLPVERKAGTAVESCEQRPEAVHGRRDGEFGTVLFVEDEENQLRLMGELLKNAGYRVLTAHDGEEAVELHARHKDEIALIVLDFGLPKLNGWEAFQRIRRLDENVSVFLATGFVSPEIEAAMRSGRLAGIINKPYRLDELLERISNLSRQVGPG